MNPRLTVLTGCAAFLLSSGIALAGPCTMANKDAGSGPTPGAASQTETTGTAARGNEHPPTASMNKAAGNEATSSQDAQRQTQGKPTAAQEAQGAKVATGNDC